MSEHGERNNHKINTVENQVVQEYKNLLSENFNGNVMKSARLSFFMEKSHEVMSENDEVSREVYERLLHRHAILQELIKIEKHYVPDKEDDKDSQSLPDRYSEDSISDTINSENISEDFLKLNTSNREKKANHIDRERKIYNMAVADLFVEKALSYLERDAGRYRKLGKFLMRAGIINSIIGLFFAVFVYISGNYGVTIMKIFCALQSCPKMDILLSPEITSPPPQEIYTFLTSLIRGITLFGMNITVSVFCFRYAQALLDQAERLYDRRHALRQGRLFVHLNNGEISIEQMDKAFQWNAMKENAFSKYNPDAQAPLSGFVKEIGNSINSAAKAVESMYKKKDKAD